MTDPKWIDPELCRAQRDAILDKICALDKRVNIRFEAHDKALMLTERALGVEVAKERAGRAERMAVWGLIVTVAINLISWLLYFLVRGRLG